MGEHCAFNCYASDVSAKLTWLASEWCVYTAAKCATQPPCFVCSGTVRCSMMPPGREYHCVSSFSPCLSRSFRVCLWSFLFLLYLHVSKVWWPRRFTRHLSHHRVRRPYWVPERVARRRDQHLLNAALTIPFLPNTVLDTSADKTRNHGIYEHQGACSEMT